MTESCATTLTAAGWIFMTVYIGFISWLTFWTMWRVLRKQGG